MVEPFVKFNAGDYGIIPFPARHQTDTDAFIYAVSHGGKSILYAHDTGYFYDEVFDFIAD